MIRFVFALPWTRLAASQDRPLLSSKYGQQLTCIVRHNPLSSRLRQQVSHRGTFVHEDPDETSRLRQRQGLTQQLHRLILFAIGTQSDRLKNQRFKTFVCQTLCFHLLTQWPQHRQRCGRVSLGQEYPGPDEGQLVLPGQISGGC